MTQLAWSLTGLEDLDAATTAVVQVLTAPATAEAGARAIAQSARPLVPVVSGELASSETVTGPHLIYAAPYAPIVSARDPWLGDAIAAAIPQLVALYGDAALEAWQ